MEIMIYNATQTAAALPFLALAAALRELLLDNSVQVPPRLVQPLAGGGSLFVMPAADARLAMSKLISFIPDNTARGLPAIQGDIVVFHALTGERLALLDAPTVTARRTAAVSLLAAQQLATQATGPMLLVGAGVQAWAHAQAFAEGMGVREFLIASRTERSALALAERIKNLGLQAQVVADANQVLADCHWVLSATSAQAVCLNTLPSEGSFVAAVGAFTPRMVEWSPEVCQQIAASAQIVLDTRDADHEAGDLLQAGVMVSACPTLSDVVCAKPSWLHRAKPKSSTVFFKSCGWAGWDLAAVRLLC
jgi:1-piperideine-2-carboxylate/1-pyrroline-2-carboxylate reductase [NAD(P)H]